MKTERKIWAILMCIGGISWVFTMADFLAYDHVTSIGVTLPVLEFLLFYISLFMYSITQYTTGKQFVKDIFKKIKKEWIEE